MNNITVKLSSAKEQILEHCNRLIPPEFPKDSTYSQDFIYTESPFYKEHHSFESLKEYIYELNDKDITKNPLTEDGKKRLTFDRQFSAIL